MFDIDWLRPGDVLLYRTEGSFWGFIIRLKTWSDVNHSETYVGDGMAAGSREDAGVGYFHPLRLDGLRYVLRPTVALDMDRALEWHRSCIGQPYDSIGVARSFVSSARGNIGKQWCSEHTARFAKKAGYYPFGVYFDSEKVAPAHFLSSPLYERIWQAKSPEEEHPD